MILMFMNVFWRETANISFEAHERLEGAMTGHRKVFQWDSGEFRGGTG